jgi:hypothetical protein
MGPISQIAAMPVEKPLGKWSFIGIIGCMWDNARAGLIDPAVLGPGQAI